MSHDFKVNNKVTVQDCDDPNFHGRVDYVSRNLVIVDWYGDENRSIYSDYGSHVKVSHLKHWVKPMKFKVGDKVKYSTENGVYLISEVDEKDSITPYRLVFSQLPGKLFVWAQEDSLTLVVDTPAQKDIDAYSQNGEIEIRIYHPFIGNSIRHSLNKEQTAKLREILG